MQYKRLCCWDCGVQVINENRGHHSLLPNYSHVRFHLSNGAYMENPFCQDCAARPWPASRLEEYRQAIEKVAPQFRAIAITEMAGLQPRPEIQGVV